MNGHHSFLSMTGHVNGMHNGGRGRDAIDRRAGRTDADVMAAREKQFAALQAQARLVL